MRDFVALIDRILSLHEVLRLPYDFNTPNVIR